MKTKNKRLTLSEVLEKELKDPELSFYFHQEKSISDVAKLVRNARLKESLTQNDLAKKAKTTQTVIARLESGVDSRVPSLSLLGRIAQALQTRLHICFEHPKLA